MVAQYEKAAKHTNVSAVTEKWPQRLHFVLPFKQQKVAVMQTHTQSGLRFPQFRFTHPIFLSS